MLFAIQIHIFAEIRIIYNTVHIQNKEEPPPPPFSFAGFYNLSQKKSGFSKSPKFTQSVLFIVTFQEQKSNTVVLSGGQITVDGSEIRITAYWSLYRWFPVFASTIEYVLIACRLLWAFTGGMVLKNLVNNGR